MPLQAPIDRATHQLLRAAVANLRETERRRWFPTEVNVGHPDHDHVTMRCDQPAGHRADPTLTDHAERVDVTAWLLRRGERWTPRPIVWFTRPGTLHVHDADVLWSSSARMAIAQTGIPGHFVVVTRHGWRDPETDVRREWRRLRRHR